jgi:hypothetical protein
MTRSQLGTTIDSDAKKLLQLLAEQDNRSVANYLETLIRREAEQCGVKLNGSKPKKTIQVAVCHD